MGQVGNGRSCGWTWLALWEVKFLGTDFSPVIRYLGRMLELRKGRALTSWILSF